MQHHQETSHVVIRQCFYNSTNSILDNASADYLMFKTKNFRQINLHCGSDFYNSIQGRILLTTFNFPDEFVTQIRLFT